MSNLLRISDAASLALHTMVFLAGETDDLVSAHRIAAALCVSENHLAKVCQRLARLGLISAVRGPKGGLRLARPAEKITLMEVYEAMDGPLRPGNCLLGGRPCGRRACILGDLMDTVNREVVRHLSGTTLADLVKER
jgi:Rrf2 family protein